MLCPIKVNSNTIELTVHTSCYCVLDLLCVKSMCCVFRPANACLRMRSHGRKQSKTNYFLMFLIVFEHAFAGRNTQRV